MAPDTPGLKSAQATRNVVVLCVGDDAEGLRLCSIFFADHSLLVVEATDGTDAFRKALVLRPRLMVIDLQAARLDGQDTARKLKLDRRTRQISTVALSNNVFPHRREDAELAGFDGFFEKPVEASDVFRVMTRLLSSDTRNEGHFG